MNYCRHQRPPTRAAIILLNASEGRSFAPLTPNQQSPGGIGHPFVTLIETKDLPAGLNTTDQVRQINRHPDLHHVATSNALKSKSQT
jgi:hypothetical protein